MKCTNVRLPTAVIFIIPTKGTEKETPFKDLPDDWKCPICGAGKKMF